MRRVSLLLPLSVHKEMTQTQGVILPVGVAPTLGATFGESLMTGSHASDTGTTPQYAHS